MTRPLSMSRGFTIIEVLVVIVIMGVLLALAAPSFRTFTASQKVKTASFDMYAALIFARSEAIKRRQNVTVTANGGEWKNGWTVAAGGVDLRKQDALTGVRMTLPNDVTTLTSVVSFVYRLDGRLSGGTAAIRIVPESGAPDAGDIQHRCLRVDSTGLPRSISIQSGQSCA